MSRINNNTSSFTLWKPQQALIIVNGQVVSCRAEHSRKTEQKSLAEDQVGKLWIKKLTRH